jgi:replicative DNA helicase
MKLADRMQRMADNPQAHRGLSTGFDSIDAAVSGLSAGQLCVLAARPSMGKTALAINIASHVALRERKPVVVFSLEMSNEELSMRIVAGEARVPLSDVINGTLSESSWSRFAESADSMSDAPMITDDASSLSVSEIRARARSFARKYKGQLSLVVVDHIHIMDESGSNQSDNKASRMGEISRSLKAMAKELGCPVIALAQLNRSVESRADKRPLMSDLRESGAIEQDADIIMFLYRDEYYTKDACKEPGVAELIIAKQRNGPTVTLKLGFQAELVRFQELSS